MIHDSEDDSVGCVHVEQVGIVTRGKAADCIPITIPPLKMAVEDMAHRVGTLPLAVRKVDSTVLHK